MSEQRLISSHTSSLNAESHSEEDRVALLECPVASPMITVSLASLTDHPSLDSTLIGRVR